MPGSSSDPNTRPQPASSSIVVMAMPTCTRAATSSTRARVRRAPVGYAPLVAPELDATPLLPKRRTMASVERAAQGCRGCPLYLDTTQAVVGTHEAPRSLMLVGEQPGDVEDRKGEVFVGPAGGVLRNVLEELGIPVESLYMTN